MIYPQSFEQKIGFDQIRELLQSKCLGPLGQERVEKMAFSSSFEEIDEWLTQVMEYVRVLQEEEECPSQHFFDLRASLKRIGIEGMFLDEKELFDLRRSQESIQRFQKIFRPSDEEELPPYPSLYRLSAPLDNSSPITQRIDRILNPFGKIKDNASPELARIRQELATTMAGISRLLNRILRSVQSEGLVDKDVAPSVRDGRLVIPVSAGAKRKIRGIVHDESSSGKTVFIEPAEVVESNNRIRELENEERREIIRILQEFSASLRPDIPALLLSYDFLAQMDFIRAKAVFTVETRGIRPTLLPSPFIDWTDSIHPLLQKSLERHGKKVVPLDIFLDEGKRLLVISGPNAGGKSVCLKTVSLLQYMLQCGIPISVHERSRAGIFRHILIDIGDEQSIEDELSTYSSHLSNMKAMIKHCDHSSLILIDEFGGGTEPQIGGAIAEAILKRLNSNRTFGIITTHYQNLKHFAEENEGIVNGAMLYDRHRMQALFQLQIGNPGSSFAIEIARKIGLPEEVIKDASDIVGSEYVQADKYLQDIVRDKRYWENKRQSVRQREKQLEETIERYQRDIEELHRSRKETLSRAQEEAKQLLQEANARIENTIRSIKEAQAEKEQTRLIRQELSDFRGKLDDTKEFSDKIARQMERLKEKQARKQQRKNEQKPTATVVTPAPQKPRTIQVGDTVKLKGQTTVGQVTELNGSKATVIFGNLLTTVVLSKLELTHEKIASPSEKSSFVSTQTSDHMYEKKLQFKQDIDVRGMRGDEAIQAVTYFVDDAILVGMDRVRILHGTGNGILRSLIRQYLSTVGGVRHFADEHIQLGGAGITVVDLH